jgi:endonuclease-8
MPEGDTIFRTAVALRSVLVGGRVIAARAASRRGRGRARRMDAVVGSTVTRVESRGKHLLIGFDNGLTLRTHMRMSGSWHRYAPGEPWRRSSTQASVIIEVPGAVTVCFNAPTVELLGQRDL